MNTDGSAPHQQPPTGSTFPQLWELLTRPHSTLTTIEQRRQSRLLSGLLLAISGLTFIINANGQITPSIIWVWVNIALTLGIYLLNRRGRYQIAAGMFIGLNFFLVHFSPLITGDYTWLLFAGMLLIIGAALLPLRRVLMLFAGSFVTQIVVGTAAPMTLSLTNFAILIVFTISTMLLIVFVTYRTGLEREQRAALETANQKLRDSEARLEQRVAERTRELHAAKR